MIKRLILISLLSGVGLLGCSAEPETTQEDKASQKQAVEQELLLHVPSPDWRDQVVYFLMTDRFNDGDASNNDQGLGEFDPTKSSKYSGGDIQGVIDELDYIQNMGMTAVWLTPIVANQWWSDFGQYSSYHGYWATDFSSVDKHVGTLETYQKLSDQLHRRGMYLVKDIVVNHTGNFFNYKDGQSGYNPENTAENFYLLEPEDSAQPAPTQKPFDLIDRNNPEHVAANIYNWTPSITDYNNVDHQFTYQLASLADINTTNPVVIERFKQIYGDWIKLAGIDAFRIDTVRYVEHEFFHAFMHDPDGIHAAAKATGRDNFLAFGEVFDTSKPYENKGEHKVNAYFGSPEKPELNSLISFPLHHDLKTVFGQGLPTDHLAYRIQQHMAIYNDPYVMPTFIDNHDMGRFLASGDVAGLKQALATILTIPGIPVIYQGTAQAMTETRDAMFAGGYNAKGDVFDQTSEVYQFISELAKLRTSDKLFTRGDIKLVASNKNGPGVLAYTRSYEGRKVLVMFNTSRHEILVNGIGVSDGAKTLKSLHGDLDKLQLNSDGELTTLLPGRAIVIAEIEDGSVDTTNKLASPVISIQLDDKIMFTDFVISGTAPLPNKSLLLVNNSRKDTAIELVTDDKGAWEYTFPVNNLGEELVSLVAYQPEAGTASEPLQFRTKVEEPEWQSSLTDPANDDTGPTGKYSAPTHEQSLGQMDILGAELAMGGEVLKITLQMRNLTDDWIPSYGFDNAAFSIFFDLPDLAGNTELPLMYATMPEGHDWDLGHVVYGWGTTTYSSKGSDSKTQGERFGIAPLAEVDKAAKTITLTYKTSDFGFSSWAGSTLYITTWDITGEGMYRKLSEEQSDWSFGGGAETDPKVLDSMLVSVPAK